ncbi:2OG-Fe(II) oxygenase family protein [Nocardioides sp. Kera G14]|uniref:2OG-Fe(II) oxygenase family protein n=1 Tax=Nocardioides sp. Kera G14 TaxID=2884264 RepID=UPI001D12250A|nr:2OG-Fe(II) oxygenase family protein [Nocardioides sp. Kera G14]UDY25349.1 hypothetical protein LH076_05575 [Nocardioides sp. Kera G14]
MQGVRGSSPLTSTELAGQGTVLSLERGENSALVSFRHFDCLTLLFQREGQHGLQVCPGRDLEAPEWTPVPPSDDAITCNIGDMLMRWSDDQLLSNFHRVRSPLPGEYTGARYSIPFFAQANRDVVITTPQGKYEPITAYDYLLERIAANYGEGAAKRAAGA